jgi:hypothetical protein
MAETLSKSQLSDIIIATVGSKVESHGPLDEDPLRLKVEGLVRLAIYRFNVHNPPGGRHKSELKIQLIAPGHKRGERGSFIPPPGHFPVLLGYSVDYKMFVLWDAYKHEDFAWSKNCQVRMQALTDAQTTGRGQLIRNLSGSRKETVLTARPDHLLEVLSARITTQ